MHLWVPTWTLTLATLIRPKKIMLLFPEKRRRKKFLPGRPQKNNILFELYLKNYSDNTFRCWKTKSLKFVTINLLAEFVFLLCVVFWKKKYIFSYTIDLCERVGDKKNFTRPISGNKTTFFGLIMLFSLILEDWNSESSRWRSDLKLDKKTLRRYWLLHEYHKNKTKI